MVSSKGSVNPTMTERDNWNTFKKRARQLDPLGSKLDYKYYKRLRLEYKAQTDNTSKLTPWLKKTPPIYSLPNHIIHSVPERKS